MEKLRKEIIAEEILKTNFHDQGIKERLVAFRPQEFIPYFLLNSGITYNHVFFLSNLVYWEQLDYSDWKNLLVQMSHRSLGIYSFFVITYKYLKIDFLPFFCNLETDHHDLKTGALKRFYENPHILQHDDEADKLMTQYHLDKKCLVRIRKKLLLQGATKAETVQPRKKLRVGYTKINPPSSWGEWSKCL